MSNERARTTPGTGRAAVWIEPNVIGVRELPMAEPGPGEILVRIRAAGICGSDLHPFHGEAQRQNVPGNGPGHELVGEVAELGPGVDGPEPGTRIAVFPARVCDRCQFCRAGRIHLCPSLRLAGGGYTGGMREYYLAQAPYVYRVPDSLDWPVAALSEPCAISLHAMKRAGVARGQRVLVLGAGTIGLFAALVARDAGASRVGITARYAHQAAAARSLGVTDVFEPSEVEGFEPVGGEAWDIVVESIGGGHQTLGAAINMAARGGKVMLLGVHTVPQAIPTWRIFFHEVDVIGAFGYDHVGPRSDYDETLALLAKYRDLVAPLVTHTFPLERADEAFATALDKRSGAIKVTVLP